MDSIRLLYRVIVTDNTAIGLSLVVALALMALIAALMARFHYKRYRGLETRYLNQVKARLRSILAQPIQKALAGESAPAVNPKPSPDSTAPMSKAAHETKSYLVSADELAATVPPHSLIGDRLRVIALMRKSHTKVNMAALQQISRAREASRTSLRFPAMAINLAMLIGLLGTFIGIAIVIQQIGININRGDGSLESFGRAFGGMYTKFSTTLVALACSVVISSLNFRLAQAQERLFEDLDRFTVAELLPATVPSLEDETLLERVSQQLEQSFTLLHDISEKNAATVQEVSAIQAGFVDIVAGIRQQMRSEASDRLQNLLGHVVGLMQQMGRVSDSLQGMASGIPAALNASNQRIEQALTSQVSPVVVQSKWPQGRWLFAFGAIMLCLLITILVKLR